MPLQHLIITMCPQPKRQSDGLSLHQRMRKPREKTDHRIPTPHRGDLDKDMRTTIPTKMHMVVETQLAMRPLEADGLMPTAVINIGKKPNREMKPRLTAAMMETPITATHVQISG